MEERIGKSHDARSSCCVAVLNRNKEECWELIPPVYWKFCENLRVSKS